MTERERLMDLLNYVRCEQECCSALDGGRCGDLDHLDRCQIVTLADHLLRSGVIVPPCKVGDKVYSITECSCEDIDGVHTECEFYGYGTDDRICTIPNGEKCPYQYRIKKCYVTETNILMFARMWDKTVFFSHKDAEKALKERSEGK